MTTISPKVDGFCKVFELLSDFCVYIGVWLFLVLQTPESNGFSRRRTFDLGWVFQIFYVYVSMFAEYQSVPPVGVSFESLQFKSYANHCSVSGVVRYWLTKWREGSSAFQTTSFEACGWRQSLQTLLDAKRTSQYPSMPCLIGNGAWCK